VIGLEYTQRQDADNGRIKDFTIEVSPDGATWTQVAAGAFTSGLIPQQVRFAATAGRYVRLTGLSSPNGAPYAGGAEINVGGARR
jgi:hypothetical protein